MNKTLTILVCIMVAGVVVGASLPIFDSLTASSESVHNEGAGWVRFALDRNAGTTYSLSYTSDDDGFYIDNGTDRQTYDDSSTVNFDTILYADSNLSVWVDGSIHILGTNEGNPFYLEGSGDFTIVRDAEGVTVTPDGSDPVTFGVPTWSYIPVSTGNYGFFLASDLDDELGNGVKNYPSDMPLAVVGGGFAGVYAYNDIYRYNGLGLNMHPVYDDDGLFYGAYWDKTAPVEPESLTPDVLDPAIIDLDPIDIDLDPLNPGAQLMAVPTPTYTDGDWGYDTMTVDGVTYAKIVSYSGAGGGVITVPATVGGYNVHTFGKGTTNGTVFATTTSATGLIFSEGIEVINKQALNGCTSMSGTLSIPNTVTSILDNAFRSTGFSGELIIPDSVTTMGSYAFSETSITSVKISNNLSVLPSNAFSNCSALTGTVILPDSVTELKSSVFNNCFSLTQIIYSKNLHLIGSSCFGGCAFVGSIVIPDTVTDVSNDAYQSCKSITGSIVIPNSVTTLGYKVFQSCTNATSVVIASDVVPLTGGGDLFFYTTHVTEVLDLSDTVDYSVDRNGLPNTATVSDSIGDCFGFVSVVDYTTGGGGSPTQQLIAILPLIMVLGLVLMAVGIFIWNRM